MTDYEFGDVVLVTFPFTDMTTAKKRPAVVVSSVACSRNRADIILMAVTSQMQSIHYLGDVPVVDWRQAGLLKPSIIKPVFTTLEKVLILRKLGRLSEGDRAALKQALKAILGE